MKKWSDLSDMKKFYLEEFIVKIIALVIATVVALIAVIPVYSEFQEMLKSKNSEEEINIVNLVAIDLQIKEKISIEETFVLGTGSISNKNEDYYFAYEVLEDGGKKLYKMNVNTTIIYDDLSNEEKAYAVVISKSNKILKTNLHVPVGTIIENINVNEKD